MSSRNETSYISSPTETLKSPDSILHYFVLQINQDSRFHISEEVRGPPTIIKVKHDFLEDVQVSKEVILHFHCMTVWQHSEV